MQAQRTGKHYVWGRGKARVEERDGKGLDPNGKCEFWKPSPESMFNGPNTLKVGSLNGRPVLGNVRASVNLEATTATDMGLP